MKHIIIALILHFTIVIGYAQKAKPLKVLPQIQKHLTDFYVIEDKDGYVNLRNSPKVEKGNIASKLVNKTIVYHILSLHDTINWCDVSTFKNGKVSFGEGGFIYRDRMKNIDSYQPIPQKKLSQHQVMLKKDSIEVVIEDKKFDRKHHKVKIYQDGKTEDKVDGKGFWGCDSGADYLSREYAKFSVIIGIDTINIPKIAYADLFNGNIQDTQVFYDIKQDILYIQSHNSDGAGSYDVLWVIEKRKYRERYIFWGW